MIGGVFAVVGGSDYGSYYVYDRFPLFPSLFGWTELDLDDVVVVVDVSSTVQITESFSDEVVTFVTKAGLRFCARSFFEANTVLLI